MNAFRSRHPAKRPLHPLPLGGDTALTKADYAKLTKAQLIEEVMRQKSAAQSLIDDAHNSMVH